jgi:hypothetical protein
MSAKSAHLSQFETMAPKQRVVLLGASNLSIKFPTVVHSARAMFDAPLEFFVAKGFGRSYGQESKFFGKKILGILQSGLWAAMHRAPPIPTLAIVADIGNDLAYEAPVRKIIDWVEETLDRLAAHRARVVLNNIPWASISAVGAARYHFFRELFFPSCSIPRGELLTRAQQLSEALTQLAEERKTPIFSGHIEWYGFDPIHPRRTASGEIWRLMLSALTESGSLAPLVGVAPISTLKLHRLQPESWSHFGVARSAAQPACRLSDGTTIALY